MYYMLILYLLQNSICTSFATSGKPTHPAIAQLNWEPVRGPAPFKCLNICEQLSVIELPNTERVQFWESLYDYV